MGLGMIADQLAELKLGELLDTPPPGLDEAVAIGKVRPTAHRKELFLWHQILLALRNFLSDSKRFSSVFRDFLRSQTLDPHQFKLWISGFNVGSGRVMLEFDDMLLSVTRLWNL